MKKVLFAIVVIAAVVGFSWLNSDISSKKAQPDMAGAVSKDIVMMSDDDPRIDVWSKNFPEHADMYQAVETEAPFETEFGGNHSYSKLICYPQLTILWAGYPCHVEYYLRPTGTKTKAVVLSQVTQLKNGRTALKKTMMSLIAAEMATKLLKLK